MAAKEKIPRNFHIARKGGQYEHSHMLLACGTNLNAVLKAAVERWNTEYPDPDYPATQSMVDVETVCLQPVSTPGYNGDEQVWRAGKRRYL